MNEIQGKGTPINPDRSLDARSLEAALGAALQREAAPSDFAAKVLARAGAPLPKSVLAVVKQAPKPWLQRPFALPKATALALAAALAAVAIVPAVLLDYQHREEVRGLKARQDLLTALAITRDQLQQARQKVRRTTRIVP